MSDRDMSVIESRLIERVAADGRASKCEQICQTLRRYIGSGQLGAGQQLPAERALSERFATTRITIKDALQPRGGWPYLPGRATRLVRGAAPPHL